MTSDILRLSPAYRLKKCPPPPVVENAELIYEDEDFQIGNSFDLFLAFLLKIFVDAVHTENNKVINFIFNASRL